MLPDAVLVKVTKRGVSKVLPLLVNVVDVVSPTISLGEESITKNQGEGFDVGSNISDIMDDVDGRLGYLANEEVTEGRKNYSGTKFATDLAIGAGVGLVSQAIPQPYTQNVQDIKRLKGLSYKK